MFAIASSNRFSPGTTPEYRKDGGRAGDFKGACDVSEKRLDWARPFPRAICPSRPRHRTRLYWSGTTLIQCALRSCSCASAASRKTPAPMIRKAAEPRSRPAQLAGRCARCGKAFECGTQAGREHCWCEEFPALSPAKPGTGCYCPRCLEALIETNRTGPPLRAITARSARGPRSARALSASRPQKRRRS